MKRFLYSTVKMLRLPAIKNSCAFSLGLERPHLTRPLEAPASRRRRNGSEPHGLVRPLPRRPARRPCGATGGRGTAWAQHHGARARGLAPAGRGPSPRPGSARNDRRPSLTSDVGVSVPARRGHRALVQAHSRPQEQEEILTATGAQNGALLAGQAPRVPPTAQGLQVGTPRPHAPPHTAPTSTSVHLTPRASPRGFLGGVRCYGRGRTRR